MLDQYHKIGPADNGINLKDKKLKQKCYSLLQSNHNILWQNFITSIFNHIEYTELQKFSQNKMKLSQPQLQKWLKQQIECVLRWFSNPQNRSVQVRFQTTFRRFHKEKIQWEATFTKLLEQQWESKNQYEKEIEILTNKIKELQEYTETIQAKNSVLQSMIKNLTLKQEKILKRQQSNYKSKTFKEKTNNLCIKNQLNVQFKPFLNSISNFSQLLTPKVETCDSQTMTMDILNKIQEENNSLAKKLNFNQAIFDIKLDNKQKVLSIHHILPIKCEKIKLITQDTEIQTQKPCNINIFSVTEVINFNYEPPRPSLQQSLSSISSSSYILQVDHGTQTVFTQCRDFNSQTDEKYPNQNVLAALLMKISLLETEVEEKNQKINTQQESLSKGFAYVQSLKKQIQDLQADLQVNQQIEEHLEKASEQYKAQLQDLNYRYKQIVNKLSNQLSSPSQTHEQQSQTQAAQTWFQSPFPPHKKIQEQDDQLLTNQSQQQQHSQILKKVSQFASHSQNCVSLSGSSSTSTLASTLSTSNLSTATTASLNKGEIVRNLVEYMRMEIEQAKFQKKASFIVAAVMMLGVEHQEQETVLRKYIQKIGGLNKKKQCGLETKLYSYLTQQI